VKQQHPHALRGQRGLHLEGELAAVGQLIADLEERALVAVVGLDGKVEGVVVRGAVGIEM